MSGEIPDINSLIDAEPDGALAITKDEQDCDAPKAARYEERVVAFVDVLGFKELIKKSAEADHLVATLFNALSVSKKELVEIYSAKFGIDAAGADVKVHSFSDFLVVSALPTAHGIGLVCYLVFKHCRQLLNHGLTSRGGIAVGRLLHHETAAEGVPTMVFGPAFIEAYQLESIHADAPRVIIQNKLRARIGDIISAGGELAAFLLKHIVRAQDGPAYVNIFADFCVNHDLANEVDIIRDHMCRTLDECTDKPHHFKKNAHLATEFNRSVAKTPYAHLSIPTEKLPSWKD